MYWYLSFLRPPPTQVSLGSQITITPQIANDLRTELLFDSIGISYIFERITGKHKRTSPQILTIWNPPGNTYSPISISLPKEAKVGESWRLGLFAISASSSSGTASTSLIKQDLLDLGASEPGILAVWSEGIEIVIPKLSAQVELTGSGRASNGESKSKKAKTETKVKEKGKEKGKERVVDAPKQGRIQREWSLGEDAELRIIEQTSFDLDKKIWDSGLALSSLLWRYLKDQATTSSAHPLMQDILRSLRLDDQTSTSANTSTRILELGSGTGLVSIALAKVLQHCSEGRSVGKTNIVATDLESAIELMNENIELNSASSTGAEEESRRIEIQARILDWDDDLPEWVGMENNQPIWPNLIIAADVTYNTAAFPSLLKTLSALLKPSKREAPMLLLAYKERDPGERELWELLKKEGIDMTLVEKVQGAQEDGQVEIWVGRRC